jgi:hypothetical protein
MSPLRHSLLSTKKPPGHYRPARRLGMGGGCAGFTGWPAGYGAPPERDAWLQHVRPNPRIRLSARTFQEPIGKGLFHKA